jgi:hypothetical protein
VFLRAIPAVTVTSVTPGHLLIGVIPAVTISGTNVLPGAVPDRGDVQTSNVMMMDENTITLDVTLPSDTPAGAQDVHDLYHPDT